MHRHSHAQDRAKATGPGTEPGCLFCVYLTCLYFIIYFIFEFDFFFRAHRTESDIIHTDYSTDSE